MSTRLGIAFVPTLPPEALVPLARAADQHLDDLWVWEDCFKQSGIACSATALAVTERVRVGLGLMPAPLRNVALTAMEVATLHRVFPGRFVPGVGHGVQDWMAQVGAKVESPMTLLEEYLVALRRLLAGEEVTVHGRYVQLDRVRLEWPPGEATPLMAGGFGPRTQELAGRLADGILMPGGLSAADLESAVARAQAGGAGPATEVVHTVITATGPDASARAGAELAAAGAAPEPTRMAAGGPHEIAAVIRRCLAAGATTVVVQPTADLQDAAGLAAFLGEQVRPLL